MVKVNLKRKPPFIKTWSVPILLLVVLLISLVFEASHAKFVEKEYDPKPHVIFLLHGLLGDPTTFGDLEKILEYQYREHKNIRVKTLYYPSIPEQGNSTFIEEMIPYDYARIINTQMINYLVEEGLKDKANGNDYPIGLDTPVSFIVHSQGGSVVLRYLNSCYRKSGQNPFCKYRQGIDLMEKAGWFSIKKPHWLDNALPHLQNSLFKNYQLKEDAPSPSNIHTWVTLGSPFWGSAVANRMIRLNSSLNNKNQGIFNPLNVFGLPRGQINHLAIGSETVAWARSLMLDRYSVDTEEKWSDKTPWVSRYPETLRVYNVAGIFNEKLSSPKESLLKILETKKFESDIVVGAPEARLDFIYYIENRNSGGQPLRGKTNLVKDYYPTLMTHLPLADFKLTSFPLADIRWSNHQEHLSYRLIKRAFDYEFGISRNDQLSEQIKNELVVEKLQNFSVDLKILTPPEYYRQFGLRNGNIKIIPEDPKRFESVDLKGAIHLSAKGINSSGLRVKNNYYQTFYHIGRFSDSFAYLPRKGDINSAIQETGLSKLNYSLNILGFEEKNISLDVFPSITTYAEIYLKPYHPIQPAQVQDQNGNTFLHKLSSDGSSDIYLVLNKENQIKKYKYSKNQVDSISSPFCRVGLLGKKSPISTKGYSTRADWEKYGQEFQREALNKATIQENFHDPEGSIDLNFYNYAKKIGKDISYGMPFEVLARVKKEVINPVTNKIELMDKYLVTSPLIREYDSLKQGSSKFADVGPDIGETFAKGLRWIKVIDIDILKTTKPLQGDSYAPQMLPPNPEDPCFKDNTMILYPETSYFQKIFYID